MRIFILLYCRRPDLLYGTTLIFRTLRVGFPTARINIVDNASVEEVRPVLRELAAREGCEFVQLTAELQHHDFLAQVIGNSDDEPLVFVDPDVVFWESCEGWQFDGLAAGRLIPRFLDDYTGCVTEPRLHTSFLWIPRPAVFRQAMHSLKAWWFDFEPIRPLMFFDSGCGWRRLDTGATLGGWRRQDTGAALYAALPEKMVAFGPRELGAYDHLFVGSHIDLVTPALDSEKRGRALEIHRLAREGELSSLKGLWIEQDEFFRRRAVWRSGDHPFTLAATRADAEIDRWVSP